VSIIEWVAAIFSLAGAWLLGYRSAAARRAGWGCFLGSNIMWLMWGVSIAAWPFVVVQVCFTVTSVRGLIITTKEK